MRKWWIAMGISIALVYYGTNYLLPWVQWIIYSN